jgi:hypothetical protein
MYAWVKKKEGNSKKDPRVKNRKSPKKEYNIKHYCPDKIRNM